MNKPRVTAANVVKAVLEATREVREERDARAARERRRHFFPDPLWKQISRRAEKCNMAPEDWIREAVERALK